IVAARDRDTARQSNYPFHSHSLIEHWTVAGSYTRLLTLVGETYTYTGGAHGMTGYRALLFDRARGAPVQPEQVFARWPALLQQIRPAFCRALDATRAARREGEIGTAFAECLDPASEVVVPKGPP